MDKVQSLKIRNLVKLLDAESPHVREMVQTELIDHAHHLKEFLDTYKPEFPPELMYELQNLLSTHTSRALRGSWLDWQQSKDETARLEMALTYLGGIQQDPSIYPLSQMLDDLTDEFKSGGNNADIFELNRFLFGEGRLVGAEADYYHPLHSHLGHVIANGKGLPISLVAIFILCGARLGLNIFGFNLPGHFLARAEIEGVQHLFDCFNKGKVLARAEMTALTLSSRINFRLLMENPPSANEIVTRVLLNLINAYYRDGSLDRYHLVQELLADLRNQSLKSDPGMAPRNPIGPLFKKGNLIRHKRYGYRGVIVEMDLSCLADDSWYCSNNSQPNRDQPWYHVLVDSSTATTYAAQSSLEPDPSNKEIHHPLVALYFNEFLNGGYQRNQVPWTLPS